MLNYKGAQSYLQPDQRVVVIAWLKEQKTWNVEQLQQYLETTYGVTFQSRQSYYELLAAAGITWKKAQRAHPSKDPAEVAKKKERLANT